MSVYRRGESWYIDVIIRGRRIHRKAGNGRKAALEFQENLKAAARQEKLRERSLISFHDAAARYLLHVKATRSPRTYEMEHTDYWKQLYDIFKYYFIQDITNDVLLSFQARQSAKYAPRTVNIHMGLIRKIIRFSQIPTSLKYPMLREPKKLHSFLTPDEVGLMLQLASREQKGPLSREARSLQLLALARIRFGMLTGLRPAELAYLSWDDIDTEMKTLRIRSKPDVGWKVKTAEERRVNLSAEAIASLVGLPRYGRWVFSQGENPVLSIRRSISTLAKAAGIKRKITPNVLRHTFATLALAAGASSRAVQALMGHSSLATTERYLEALESSRIEAVDLLGGIISRGGKCGDKNAVNEPADTEKR